MNFLRFARLLCTFAKVPKITNSDAFSRPLVMEHYQLTMKTCSLITFILEHRDTHVIKINNNFFGKVSVVTSNEALIMHAASEQLYICTYAYNTFLDTRVRIFSRIC